MCVSVFLLSTCTYIYVKIVLAGTYIHIGLEKEFEKYILYLKKKSA